MQQPTTMLLVLSPFTVAFRLRDADDTVEGNGVPGSKPGDGLVHGRRRGGKTSCVTVMAVLVASVVTVMA